MKRIKSTTQLTVFTTLLITAAFLLLYLMFISIINEEMKRQQIDYTYRFVNPSIFALLIFTVVLSYFISSLIIDRIFNPIRIMTVKVNEIGNMNFKEPLVISSENDEFKEYADAFNKMSENLKSHIERQKRFTSDSSHELVTPITIINGHADLLLRHYKTRPELLDTELSIIKSEALRMNELVEGLLLLARSDNGINNYVFERIQLTRIILESISEVKIIAPDFEFEVNTEDIYIKCDELAIRRVLRIILSNAVKYSKDIKHISINAQTNHGLTNISIKDKGIGISSEHLPLIFDRFYRVDDSRSKKTGSSGLGLAIAKEIINAHGGEIQVVSEPEHGTEFNIILSS